MRKFLVSALMGVALLGSVQPARADDLLTTVKDIIFGKDIYEEGIVNYIQPSWFSIMHDGTHFTRVMVGSGIRIPFEMQVGNQVGVTARPDDHGNFYLVDIKKLRDSVPLPPPTPGR